MVGLETPIIKSILLTGLVCPPFRSTERNAKFVFRPKGPTSRMLSQEYIRSDGPFSLEGLICTLYWWQTCFSLFTHEEDLNCKHLNDAISLVSLCNFVKWNMFAEIKKPLNTTVCSYCHFAPSQFNLYRLASVSFSRLYPLHTSPQHTGNSHHILN